MSGHDNHNATNTTFMAVSQQRRTMLLDLPQFILEEIIICLRQTIRWDGYLTDLRLVSKQFNEAIIHCLLFRCKRESLYSRRYTSCPGLCHRDGCSISGECNSTYTRFHMQSYISSNRENNSELIEFHRNLVECLENFREILRHNPNLFSIARTRLEDRTHFETSSSKAVLNDAHCHALSEAVIKYLDTCLDERELWDWQPGKWSKQAVSRHSALFWLQCLACYFSDPELLTWAMKRAEHTGKACDNVEYGELLGVLASYGHVELFKQYHQSMPKGIDLYVALRGACLSGSMPIATLVFTTIPADQLADVCSRTLLRIGDGRSLPSGYANVAEEVLKRCGQMSAGRIGYALRVQADLRASSMVRLLLTNYPGRMLYPIHGCTKWKWTPVFAACVNRDLQMLRDIVNLGYFKGTTDNKDVYEVYKNCEEIAAQVNSLEILEQLCIFQNKKLHDAGLPLLAAIDGSIPAMMKRLKAHPDTERNETSPALGRAIARFRVRNAIFLLERGTQLDEKKDYPKRMEWRYRRAHEREFQDMRALLQTYNLAHLFKVERWC